MPRFIVERVFPDGLDVPTTPTGELAVTPIIANNAGEGVNWIHSFVSDDRTRTYCLYDSPDVAALRRAAERSELPVDRVTKVDVLDPYAFVGAAR